MPRVITTKTVSSSSSSSPSALSFEPKPSRNEDAKQQLKESALDVDIISQINSFDPFQFLRNDTMTTTTIAGDSTSLLSSLTASSSSSSSSAAAVEKEQTQQIGIWAARALLLLVAVLWGTNFASVKYLETLCFNPPCNHLPSEAALARFGVAALVSLPVLIGKRLDVILAGLECGLWVTMGYVTQAAALSDISSGKCAFICSLTVVVVPLIETLFLGKPLKKLNIASAVVALLGVGVLEGLVDVQSLLQPTTLIDTAATAAATTAAATTTTAAAAATSLATAATTTTAVTTSASGGILESIGHLWEANKGDLLALGQPIGFGCSFLRIEHYVEKFKKVEDRVITIAAAECVVVGLFALFWVLYDFNGQIPDMTYMLEPHRLAAIGWTGIMTTLVAIYFEGVALQTASATEAAITFASEPVWASLFGAWLLHESLGLSSYVGGAIITVGCLLGSVGDVFLQPNNNNKEEATVN